MAINIELSTSEIIRSLLDLKIYPIDIDKIAKQIDKNIFIFYEPSNMNRDMRIRKILYFIDRKHQQNKQLFILFGNYKHDLFDLLCICKKTRNGIHCYESLNNEFLVIFDALSNPDDLIIEKLNIFAEYFTYFNQAELIFDVFDETIDIEEFKNKVSLNLL